MGFVDKKIVIKQLMKMKEYGSLKEMRLAAENWDKPWKTLISIIMSAQSRDETTIKIAEELFRKYNTLEKLAGARYSDVLLIFKGLNYNKTKAKHVIESAKMLVNDFHGKVPESIEELIKLPGVGRKTANVFLSEHGQHALGVDTHVAYISRKLGWTRHINPHKIESDLKNLFPKNYWSKVNTTLVRFGKTYNSRRKKDELLLEIRKIR